MFDLFLIEKWPMKTLSGAHSLYLSASTRCTSKYETCSGNSISGASSSPKRHVYDDAVKKRKSVVFDFVNTSKTLLVICLTPFCSTNTSDGPVPISVRTLSNASANSSVSKRGLQGN